ncbi:Uncharacterised protein [uncultured archaeon]|nr:Uncharacterised protein [uncultured archaeon]
MPKPRPLEEVGRGSGEETSSAGSAQDGNQGSQSLDIFVGRISYDFGIRGYVEPWEECPDLGKDGDE